MMDDGQNSIIPDRANQVAGWTIAELALILLRQFKRLLAEQGLDLSDQQLRGIAAQVEAREPFGEVGDALRGAMHALVEASFARLATWGLTYDSALGMNMDDLSDWWQTTADFLELANEKINAEIRISAGSSLLALLGDDRYADVLLRTITQDLADIGSLDVDAQIARHGLLYVAGVDPGAADWLDQARAWLAGR